MFSISTDPSNLIFLNIKINRIFGRNKWFSYLLILIFGEETQDFFGLAIALNMRMLVPD